MHYKCFYKLSTKRNTQLITNYFSPFQNRKLKKNKMKKHSAQHNTQFDFGENWNNFSDNALSDIQLEQSERDFKTLINTDNLDNTSFLDIGFGQGLGLLNAAKLGAAVVGNDINPKCRLALSKNQRFFNDINIETLPVIVGSILDTTTTQEIKNVEKTFDIVHSWGVLHHTDDMWKAIEIASRFTKKGGKFIIAIYNKHWSSVFWLWIKRMYVHSPKFVQQVMVWKFYVIIALAKFLVTRKNPFKKERGMNFYYDIIDWIGGYPYEYASVEEVSVFVEKLGFRLEKVKKPQTPTGCNEFVFVANVEE